MVRRITGLLFLALLCCAWWARADHDGNRKDGHVVMAPNQLEWQPAPSLPPGAKVAALSGDPSKPGGLYAVRAKLPDGYRVPPHWHPTDENVTVLQGALLIGTGEKFDTGKMEQVPTGGFMRMPREMRHFAMAKGETIIQIHGIGPFEINYLNPADDPRKK